MIRIRILISQSKQVQLLHKKKVTLISGHSFYYSQHGLNSIQLKVCGSFHFTAFNYTAHGILIDDYVQMLRFISNKKLSYVTNNFQNYLREYF